MIRRAVGVFLSGVSRGVDHHCDPRANTSCPALRRNQAGDLLMTHQGPTAHLSLGTDTLGGMS